MYLNYRVLINIHGLKIIRFLRFQNFSAKHFNVKKSNKISVCNTYCIIQCKFQIICLMNLQKLITVWSI